MLNRGWCAAASPVMALVPRQRGGFACIYPIKPKNEILSEKMMGYDIAAA